MTTYKYYNHTKRRKATPNEIAKQVIIDMLSSLCALNEKWGCEDLTDKETNEVMRFYEKHLHRVTTLLNSQDDIQVEKF